MVDRAVLHGWAESALAHYDIRNPELCFLGHSDNITFRVDTPQGHAYLLRIHRPALPYWVGERQQPDLIASELAWLEALANEGGFTVQRPIHTKAGGLVAQEEIEGALTPVTLLTWLAGEHFSPAAPEAPALVDQFGKLVARLHEFSIHWTPPPGFTRPRYDETHFRRVFARLLRGVDLGVFSEEVYWTLRATTQALLNEINLLQQDAEHWGVIHADLHVGNFVVCPPESGANGHADIIPIDFSFCGLGHYLFDLSICLAGGLKPALRPAFVEGYRSVRALPESDLRAVDAYCLAGAMSYYAYQIDNPAERSWLQRRIPEVAHTVYSRFLAGERILWTL